MKIREITSKLDETYDKDYLLKVKKEVKNIIDILKLELQKSKINADVFVGGSFAKGTLVKNDEYDIDIFVRFDWQYENLSIQLEKAISKLSNKLKIKYEKIHGSRDYFRIKKEKMVLEFIPVIKIKNPKEARNVTDLSYFHVNYIVNKINSKLAKEITIAKKFCHAQGIYGAESYIQGFSGYGLECLLIYYKSFEKMLKALANSKEQLIIDPAKKYKNKNEILISLNQSKLKSPIVLVDPTWKERNVLAALSNETFDKFKIVAKKFLKTPNISFFEKKDIDLKNMQKKASQKQAEFLHIEIETNKQEGDIAGTKLKKFYKFMYIELERFFTVISTEFKYNEKQNADVYFVLKSKKEIIKIGPPVEMVSACKEFRKANSPVFEEKGFLNTRIKISFSAKRFIQDYSKKYAGKLKEMDITSIKVI